jgi:hypothetical protein
MAKAVKILLSGLAGGIVMFLWGFVAHGLSPLGTAGMRYLGPNEDAVIALLRDRVHEPGLYPFPFADPSLSGKAMEDARTTMAEKNRSGPHGLMIIDPVGKEVMTPDMLVTEFVTNVVTALLVACLIAQASVTSFAGRIKFAATIGLVAGIAVNVPHWNWYGFPTAFTLAEILEHVVGIGFVGVVTALILGKGAPLPTASESIEHKE